MNTWVPFLMFLLVTIGDIWMHRRLLKHVVALESDLVRLGRRVGELERYPKR